MAADYPNEEGRRMLLAITQALDTTILLGHNRDPATGVVVDGRGKPYTQFVGDHVVKPKPGDIVKCMSAREPHKWAIARFLEEGEGSGGGWSGRYYLMQELGNPKSIVRMFNESLRVLIGMPASTFFEGHKRRVYDWARGKAFMHRYNGKNDIRWYRCGGVEMTNDTLTIWERCHIWGDQHRGYDGTKVYAQPREHEMHWDKNTRLKDIVKCMLDGGFGEPFEYAPKEPTEGQGGCLKMTRKDLVSVLKDAGYDVSPREARP